ncbi:MAG TPA: pseudouridine synthase [Acidobacteriota bacterium]|jgi:23S rRNA pseudouridine2605 synthase
MLARLQKIIAAAGIASRRKAEDLIVQGQVTVNGRAACLGDKADPETDSIKVAGRRIQPERKAYIALNKPKNFLSTVSDPQGRPGVLDLVKVRERVVPAGRLDYQSEGLMILTNDGDLTRAITRAGNCPKVYLVKIRGSLNEEDRQKLESGVVLDGRKLSSCQIVPHKLAENSWYRVTLFQGVNRQIRRMFEKRRYRVTKIKRIAIGPVKLGSLKPGQFRSLTAQEIAGLKKSVEGRLTKLRDTS